MINIIKYQGVDLSVFICTKMKKQINMFTDVFIDEPSKESLEFTEKHLDIIKRSFSNLHSLKIRYKMGETQLEEDITEVQRILLNLFKSCIYEKY